MDYFRMRAVMAAAEREAGLCELDVAAREILLEIGIAAGIDGKPTHVKDLTRSERHGTLPTVVKRISDLVDGGWIVKTESPEDGRAKILSLSAKSEGVFRKMSRSLRKRYVPA